LPNAEPSPGVLLTGASQGIGKAISFALARSKHFVVGVSRTEPKELADPAQCAESGYLSWKPLDLSNGASVAQFAASLEATAIRALVLCAVDYGEGGRHPAVTISVQEWQRIIATNCIGHCLLVSLLLPKLLRNPPGIIVNVSSDVAVLPSPGRAAYAASKAGLHAMLRAVAEEHSAECLRVYQLIPTFQLVTQGMRRRRPPNFDFSSYGDPAIIAEVVQRILSSSENAIAPGAYLVRRDGALEVFPEITNI